MNDKDFEYIKLLKLKYRMLEEITQIFCKIGSPQKLGPHSLNFRNLKTQRKVFLNHVERIKM